MSEESPVLRIKEILKSKKMSLDDLSEKAGISYTYAGQVSRNEKFPSKGKLIDIAKALDVDIKELFYSTKDDHTLTSLYIKNDNGNFEMIGHLKNRK